MHAKKPFQPIVLVKAYRKVGLSKHAARERAWMLRNHCVKCADAISPKSSRFCEAHRIWHNEKSKAYRKKNPGAYSYRAKISGHRARIRVMQSLGGLFCAWCGERDYRVLTIDHANGHDAPVAQRKRSMYHRGLTVADVYKIERGLLDRSNLRVLCSNCQARNEHLRGNRRVYPEVAKAVTEAGGYVGDFFEKVPSK